MFCISFEINVASSFGGTAIIVNLAFEIDTKEIIERIGKIQTARAVPQESALLTQARETIEHNNAFELCAQGVGGTYFVKEPSGKSVAVFKPQDEEPGASGNPKKIVSSPILPPGGGAAREVAAYLLDRHAGVPETMMFEVNHATWTTAKKGSLQKYVNHTSVAADMGSSLFSVENVHNVGILDIRLLNLDRNGENLLVVEEGNQKYRLVPIDHAYILPPSIQNPVFEWMFWKQSKVPFSEETRQYISSIDVEADAEVLRGIGIPEQSIRTMKICTLLLKRGSVHNLSLFQIAKLMCGSGPKSDLANVVNEAETRSGGDESLFFTVLEVLVEDLVCRTL